MNPKYKGQSTILHSFTKRCLQQQTMMRILDTSSFNFDRNAGNFFYKLISSNSNNPNEQTTIQQTQKADDVVTIDYEFSGDVCFHLIEYPDSRMRNAIEYYNDFSEECITRQEMFRYFNESEQLSELLDKKALAEKIGSLDPVAVAEDIKQTIGYEVDSEYAGLLAESFDEVAEALIQ